MIIADLKTPYYAVIFTTLLTNNLADYEKTAIRMEELAKLQDGYLGIESTRNKIGITVSYWKDLASITCLLYTSPSPRDVEESRMPSSA